MNKRFSTLMAALLIVSTAALVGAQTTTGGTQTPTTITRTVHEATILRDDNGTRIKLNLGGIPADVSTLYLYAIEPGGGVTSLGPVAMTNGRGTFAGTEALNRFLLVASPESTFTLIASPESTLTTHDRKTKVYFRSVVPKGFTIIPRSTDAAARVIPHTMQPVGELVAAPASVYSVPMLNIPAYKRDDDTKMKVNFSGALAGARANVFITPKTNGVTELKMRFHELKDAPAGKVFTLWAVSSNNEFVRVGQIVNTGGRNEAEIKSEVSLRDFGLLVTMEDVNATMVSPLGPSLGIVEIVR